MAGLALPLGMAITRIGCFLNGDSFGKPTSMPWGVTFPEQTRISMGITGLRVHPTQLYELLLDLALFVLLLIYRRRERWEGSIFLLFLIGYSMIRFSMEVLPGAQQRGGGAGLPAYERSHIAGGPVGVRLAKKAHAGVADDRARGGYMRWFPGVGRTSRRSCLPPWD